MQKTSRRRFLKGSVLTLFASSFLAGEFVKSNPAQASLNENLNALNTQQASLICDKECLQDELFRTNSKLKERALIIDKDIAPIYSELKAAFKKGLVAASLKSEASAFVLSQMARDYHLRVVYEKSTAGTTQLILAQKGVRL